MCKLIVFKTTLQQLFSLAVLRCICVSLLGTAFRSMASQFVWASVSVWSISVLATLLSSLDCLHIECWIYVATRGRLRQISPAGTTQNATAKSTVKITTKHHNCHS